MRTNDEFIERMLVEDKARAERSAIEHARTKAAFEAGLAQSTPREEVDGEIDALESCDRHLASLDGPARARVLAWLRSKYGARRGDLDE